LLCNRGLMFGDAQLTPANTPRVKRNRKFVDSPLEGDGFELPVREHCDSRMCTHFVVNHRVAAHVPVLICRLRPGGANNSKLELLLGQASPSKCYDLGFADHRHGLEVEVAKLFPGGSRTSARWRSRRQRLIVLHDTARMGAVGTAYKDTLPRRARRCASTNRSTNKASIACVFEGRARTAYNACRKTTSTRPKVRHEWGRKQAWPL